MFIDYFLPHWPIPKGLFLFERKYFQGGSFKILRKNLIQVDFHSEKFFFSVILFYSKRSTYLKGSSIYIWIKNSVSDVISLIRNFHQKNYNRPQSYYYYWESIFIFLNSVLINTSRYSVWTLKKLCTFYTRIRVGMYQGVTTEWFVDLSIGHWPLYS